MDESEMSRTLELALPEIDRHVQQMLDRLDAATASVTVRKALHGRFVSHAVAVASTRFPGNAFLAEAIDAASVRRRVASRRPARQKAA